VILAPYTLSFILRAQLFRTFLATKYARTKIFHIKNKKIEKSTGLTRKKSDIVAPFRNAGLAQLVEQRTCNAKVISSIPIPGTKILSDCN
jgi:hypothetical protein